MKTAAVHMHDAFHRTLKLRQKFLARALLLVVLCLIGACSTETAVRAPSGSGPAPNQTAQQAGDASLATRLSEAESRWNASGVQDYSYKIEMECQLCAPPIRVVVRKGKCVQAKTSVVHWQTISCSGRTVPDLFHTIRAWMTGVGSSISASFDPTYGYPTTSFAQSNIPQDTEIYRITDFKVLR